MPTDSFEEAFGSASPSGRPGCRAKLFNCGCIVALVAMTLAVAVAVPWYGAYARIRQAVHVGTLTQPAPRDRLPRPEDIVLCREPRYLLWTSASAVAGSDMPHWAVCRGQCPWRPVAGGWRSDRLSLGQGGNRHRYLGRGVARRRLRIAHRVVCRPGAGTVRDFDRVCRQSLVPRLRSSHSGRHDFPRFTAPLSPWPRCLRSRTVRRPRIRRRPVRRPPASRLNRQPRWRSRSRRRPHRQPTLRFFQPPPPCRPRRHRKAPRDALQRS